MSQQRATCLANLHFEDEEMADPSSETDFLVADVKYNMAKVPYTQQRVHSQNFARARAHFVLKSSKVDDDNTEAISLVGPLGMVRCF